MVLCRLSPASAIETPARQAFMIDAATHAVLLDKNGDQLMHPSSMSKLMTLYILFHELKSGRVHLSDTFHVSEKAWRTQGSKAFVEVGTDVPVEQLIQGIIVDSGNDACIVVAEGIGGTEEAFVAEMNRTAQKLGMTHSHFDNPTGLPDDKHLMSARDLSTLAWHIIHDFPEYYHYFAEQQFTFSRITQGNRNRLIGVSGLGVDGMKTGHTDAGGYGITLSARQGDRRLILVLNGLDSDRLRISEGDRLLRWGFRAFENKTILRKGQAVADADVWFGRKSRVPLVATQDLLMTLPVDAASKMTFTLKYTGPLSAPVKQGTHVADLVIAPSAGAPMTVPLAAGADVPRLSGFGRLLAVADYYAFRRKTP